MTMMNRHDGDEEPTEPSPEEGDLLAEPPAKRDDEDWKLKREKDGKTTTSKSKGKWYSPVKNDQRYRAGLKLSLIHISEPTRP